MSLGLIGKKIGMTRIFDAGDSIPVTVIHVDSNRVTQIKSDENDGYSALQVVSGTAKRNRLTKSEQGHLSKAKAGASNTSKEFRVESSAIESFELGQDLNVDIFEEGQFVDVTGTSKGKGFQGGVKRWNFKTQDATHGNSLSHRAPGSIGQCQTPGRVFKGKKMAGHMGNETCTVQSLKLVKVDAEKSLLMVKGAVPGFSGRTVYISPSVKKSLSEG